MRTLEEICEEVLLQVKHNDVPTLLIYARDFLRENQISGIGTARSVLLTIDKNSNSVLLPKDNVSEIRVGVCIRGRIIELDYDKNICTTKEEVVPKCGEDAPADDAVRFSNDCACLERDELPAYYNSYYLWENIYNNTGQQMVPTYTIPAYYGTMFYKIEKGRIWLNSICPATAQLVYEYKNTGIAEVGQTQVDDGIVSMMKAYIKWKDALDNRRPNVTLLMQDYQREYYLNFYAEIACTLTSLVRTIRKNISQGKISR